MSLTGIYELPMIGNEQVVIQNKYQKLTGGGNAFKGYFIGNFVKERDGQVYRLLSFSSLKRHFDNAVFTKDIMFLDNVTKDKLLSVLDDYKAMAEKELQGEAATLHRDYYDLRDGLPDDSVIVVRTELLREFEQSINGAAAEIEYNERERYLKLIASLACLLAEKSNLYKQGEKPNANQIADAVQGLFDNLPDANKRGLGKSNIRDSISKGMKLLDK